MIVGIMVEMKSYSIQSQYILIRVLLSSNDLTKVPYMYVSEMPSMRRTMIYREMLCLTFLPMF